MIYRFVSIKEIIAKLYRNVPPNHDISLSNIIEWAGEAMDLISANPQYEKKIADLTVTNYEADLPCELVGIYQIAGPQGIPLRLHSGTIGQVDMANNPNVDLNASSETIRGIDVSTETFPMLVDSASIPEHRYYVDNDKIRVSFKEGKIRISFLAIRVDCDG